MFFYPNPFAVGEFLYGNAKYLINSSAAIKEFNDYYNEYYNATDFIWDNVNSNKNCSSFCKGSVLLQKLEDLLTSSVANGEFYKEQSVMEIDDIVVLDGKIEYGLWDPNSSIIDASITNKGEFFYGLEGTHMQKFLTNSINDIIKSDLSFTTKTEDDSAICESLKEDNIIYEPCRVLGEEGYNG